MANGMCMMAGVHDSLTRWWLMAWWSMGMMANEYDIWYYQFRMVDGFWLWTNGRMEEGIFANLCRITFVTEKCEKTDGNFCPKHRSPHPVRKKVKKNKMSQAFCWYEFFVGFSFTICELECQVFEARFYQKNSWFWLNIAGIFWWNQKA